MCWHNWKSCDDAEIDNEREDVPYRFNGNTDYGYQLKIILSFGRNLVSFGDIPTLKHWMNKSLDYSTFQLKWESKWMT